MNYKFTSWLCEYLNAQSAHRKSTDEDSEFTVPIPH